jgi:hypothetical protein
MSKMTLEIGASITGLQAALNKAKSLMSSFGSSIKSAMGSVGGQLAGIFGTGALIAFGKSAIDSAAQVAEGSKKLGLSAEEYQKLAYAAKQTGTDMDEVGAAFKKMSNVVTGAIAGDKAAIATLNSLGISLDEVKGKSPQQLFELMADALNQVTDSTQKAAYAQDIFGKGGMALIPMLDSFKALGKEAEAAGIIMSGEAVEAAHEFEKAMSKLSETLKADVVNSGLINWLKMAADGMTAIVQGTENIAAKAGVVTKEAMIKNAEGKEEARVSGMSGWEKFKYYAMPGGDTMSKEDRDKINKMFPNGAETYSPPIKQEDVSAAVDAKKKAEDEKIDRRAAADEFKKMQEVNKELEEYGKEQKKLEAEGIKEEQSIAGSIKALQEKIDLQKLINAGKLKEAAIQEAINQAEDKAGRKLSSESYDGGPSELEKVKSLAGESFDSLQKADKTKPLDMTPAQITDSVARIGGSIGGANGVNYAKDQLTTQKQIYEKLNNIASGMLDQSKGLGMGGAVWPQ